MTTSLTALRRVLVSDRRAILDYWRTPAGLRFIRYLAVSVISTLVGQATLTLVFGVLRLASPVWSTVIASVVATGPAYSLNRRWVWGKKGKSHWRKEIAPFWTVSALATACSAVFVALASHWGRSHHLRHGSFTALVDGASLLAVGTFWILRYGISRRLFHVQPPVVASETTAPDSRITSVGEAFWSPARHETRVTSIPDFGMTTVVGLPLVDQGWPTMAPDPDLKSRRPSLSAGFTRLGHWSRDHVAKESGIVVVVCAMAYLTVAVLLDFVYLIFPGDAVSRMANAFYVLYSRDPHLAAIGFVWNPGQSLGDLVFLVFKGLWSPLATHDMAGSLVCVICMTAAVHQVRSAFDEWGVPRVPRLTLTALFALDPMVLFYGANGMSEAMFVFSLVAASRYLSRWLRHDDLRSLVYAGTALGVAYLARNEVVGSALLVGPLVLVLTSAKAVGSFRARIMAGFTDTTIVLLPVIATFSGWAVMSRVIVGEWFAQLSSQYGNAAQTQALGGAGHGTTTGFRIHFEIHLVSTLAPLLPVVLVAAILIGLRRRDLLVLVPLAVVGGSLVFDLLGSATGQIGDSYRYFIATIPLTSLIAGSLFANAPNRGDQVGRVARWEVWRPRYSVSTDRRVSGTRHLISVATMTLVAVVLVAPAIPATATEMVSSSNGGDASGALSLIFDKNPTPTDVSNMHQYASVLAVGRHISGLRLPNGDIVVDNFTNCIPNIYTTIADPKVFIIPNDRDFKQILADPLTFHAHYIFLADPKGTGSLAQTDLQYPTLYATGGGSKAAPFAKLVYEVPATSSCAPGMRLYRVLRHPGQT